MSTVNLYEIFLRHPRVVTDSRQVTPGSIFFALKGETFDGNQFAAAALEQGAAYAVTDASPPSPDPRLIVVPDVLTALQDLARRHRRSFAIPVIGITGSNGKTTTKELVSSVLSARFRVHYTRGNFNNHIGVPLTLLSMPSDTEIAVIEMGANHQGEIDALCRIAEPTHGIITNIGKAHLEGFGGIEGVKRGKSELYRFLTEQPGIAFINVDEPFLSELAVNVPQKVLYGRKQASPHGVSPLVSIELLKTQPFLEVAFQDETEANIPVESRLPGAYNFGNIATAIATGKYFGVPGSQIKKAIEAYVPENMRSQIIQKGSNTFVLDAYNANPTSTREAILSFAQYPAGNKVVILGDMLELGDVAEQEHQEIAALASAQGFRQTILVGPLFASAAVARGWMHFPDVQALRNWFYAQNFEHTHFLVKGSRGIKLEQLLDP